MAEVVIGNFAYPLMGESAAEVADTLDELYLLDAMGRVTATREVSGVASLGDAFFEAVSLDEREEEELRSFLARGKEPFGLFQAKDTPLLIVRAFYCGTATFLACVLKGALKESLCHPFEALTAPPCSLYLSAHSAGAVSFSGDIHPFHAWREAYRVMETSALPREAESADLLRILCRFAVHLSAIAHCAMTYDFCGVGLGRVRECPSPYLMGVMLSCCLLAKRCGTAVHFYVDREELDAPVLHALFNMPDRQDALKELEAPYYAAQQRGLPFRLYYEPGQASTLHMVSAFCGKEISRQQLRAFKPPH